MSVDYLVRVGALAAGSVHELSSPLCTMAVLATEMRERARDPQLARDVDCLQRQIEACRRVIAELASYCRELPVSDAEGRPVDEFLHQAVEKWGALRPSVRFAWRFDGESPAPELRSPRSLGQALLVLLDNAADASPQAVQMEASWSSAELDVRVLDRGAGVPPELADALGKRPLSGKRNGNGIGLMLAASAVRSAGGSLQILKRSGGGTCAQIRLPL